MPFFREQQAVMPDGASAIHASYVHHWRIVVVSGPHAHYIISGISNCPVIAEILRGTCLDCRWIYCSGIALVALSLCGGIQVERAALAKLECTRLVIAQHIRHHEATCLLITRCPVAANWYTSLPWV